MSSPEPDRVELDTTREPWIGSFPGLGMVEVYADGTYEVHAEPDDVLGDDDTDAHDDVEARERALRHGWAEPLSFARRGFQCLGGAAVAPPGAAEGCLLLSGDTHDVAIVALSLASRGWGILTDRIVPVEWQGDALIAHPRPAPVLASARRVEKLGLTGTQVRVGSDATMVDVARVDRPLPIVAIVGLRVRRPDEPLIELVDGHRAFELVTSLSVGGALTPPEVPSPAERMSIHLRLTALPLARLHLEPAEPAGAVDELCAWWSSATTPGVPEVPTEPTVAAP